MRTIWKYRLEPEASQVHQLPKGARALSVGAVDGEIYLWALVDPQAELEDRWFYILGTGHPTFGTGGSYARFIGTALLSSRLVFHVFEPLRPANGEEN